MGESVIVAAYEHILLPLDGSTRALGALPTARALADLFGAELVALSVAADAHVDEVRRAISNSIGDESAIVLEVVAGHDPADAIIARAGELAGSLVCMSTHGRGRISGALLGSVTRRVLQSCPVPVVTLGPQADRPPYVHARTGRRPSNWPEPLSQGRVAACVDGSIDSEAVLPLAAGWARILGAELSVITVIANPGDPLSAADTSPGRIDDPTRYLEELTQRWSGDVPTIPEVIVDPTSVSAGVNAYLRRRETALVAVATHARSGFARVRLGSTAADIVRQSTVPTLALPLPTG